VKPDPALFEKLGDTLSASALQNPGWPLKQTALRTAVSRYYFSAFHIVLEWVIVNREYTKKGTVEDHDRIQIKLLFVKDDAANALDRLRKNRNTCDYNEVEPDELERRRSIAKSDLAIIKAELATYRPPS
jgi:uncharacterized protein (UPF0332 family)